MNVKTEGTGFEPVVITLDSEEEAKMMWHLLNAKVTRAVASYIRRKNGGLTGAHFASFKGKLFKQVNKVYPLRKKANGD